MSMDLPLTKATPRGLELSDVDVVVASKGNNPSKADNRKIIGKLKVRMNQLLKQVSDLTPQELFELADIQYELRELTKKK